MIIDTFDKLRFILNRQIEIALAPREAILEAINRHYGQTVGESADSMLQEFTDTAIDFTETMQEAAAATRRSTRAAPRSSGWSNLSSPRPFSCGPPTSTSSRSKIGSACVTGSTACWSNATAPPKGCLARFSPASRFSRDSTLPNAGGPKTAGSRSPWAKRNSTCGSASFPPVTASRWSCGSWTRTASRSACGNWASPKTTTEDERSDPRPNGIILVTGPTGSGKTTSLYAALNELNTPDRKIITAEDPVEYYLPGVNQVEIRHEIGLDFARVIRAMLRQAPNVILVGEMRDLETAQMGIQASLTGHLVFSTLHTNDAPSAITRLIDMGVPSYLVSSSVVAIMAQRLVRVVCQKCKHPYTPSESLIEAAGITREMAASASFAKGTGCGNCSGTGFRGRLGIFELMLDVNQDSRNDVQCRSHQRNTATWLSKKG